jgi:hypothetical protein
MEDRPAGDYWAFDFEMETDGLPPAGWSNRRASWNSN